MLKNITSLLKNRNSKVIAFGRDFMSYGVLTAMSKLVNLLLLPFFTRVFSEDSFGAIDIISTLTNLFMLLGTLSLPYAINRYYYQLTDKERERLISSAIYLGFALAIIYVFAGFVFQNQISNFFLGSGEYSTLILISIGFSGTSAITLIAQSVLRIQRRIVAYNSIEILFGAIYAFAALFAVLRLEMGLNGVFLSQLFAGVIQLIASLILIRGYIGHRFSSALLKRALKYSLPFSPSLLANWINPQASRWVLLSAGGLSAVGVFGASARTSAVVKLFATTFQRMWLPFAMSYIETNKSSRDRFYSQTLDYFSAISLIFTLILSAYSIEIASFVLPAQYHAGHVVIPWIIGGIVLNSSTQITLLGLAIAEKTIYSSISAWTGAILNILLAFALMPYWGILGVAIAAFLAELSFSSLGLYFSQKYSGLRFNIKLNLTYVVIFVSASLVFNWINSSFSNQSISLQFRSGFLIISLIVTGIVSYPLFHRLKQVINVISSERMEK
jgi:O-antigen/teichoic acid export membrane protein